MKTLATVLATAALAVAGVTTADAAVFSPANTNFNLVGTFTLVPPPPGPITTCNITISSRTASPLSSVAQVADVNITGGSPYCAVIAPSKNWTLEATSLTTVKLNNVKLIVMATPCYPSPLSLPGSWSNATGVLVSSQVVGLCVLQQLQVAPTSSVSVI